MCWKSPAQAPLSSCGYGKESGVQGTVWFTRAVPLSDGSKQAPGAGATFLSSASHLPRGFRCSSSLPPPWLEHMGLIGQGGTFWVMKKPHKRQIHPDPRLEKRAHLSPYTMPRENGSKATTWCVSSSLGAIQGTAQRTLHLLSKLNI